MPVLLGCAAACFAVAAIGILLSGTIFVDSDAISARRFLITHRYPISNIESVSLVRENTIAQVKWYQPMIVMRDGKRHRFAYFQDTTPDNILADLIGDIQEALDRYALGQAAPPTGE